ncbi:MAG: SMC-Scp complex subunit ScpB [Spirochaetaceae bacterium]
MKLKRELALVEAVLFLENEPIEVSRIAGYTQLSADLVKDAIEQLKEKYASVEHGIEPVEISGGVQFTPKAELWDFLKEKYGKKNENKLSRAALETLSIIAYSQPVTRAEIDNIRGVSSTHMVRQLQDRNLVKGVGKKDVPGKPTQYGTTREFLKIFRLNSISDLPKLDELNRDRFELESDGE